ncbi:MAG: TolC family protein [Pseudodesulfovibrio sp.]|uniref:TolC family protein n=1 Tax=Pseudodesulfovibrio sp. TaxID=2035812 RepID=UPI003D09ABFB
MRRTILTTLAAVALVIAFGAPAALADAAKPQKPLVPGAYLGDHAELDDLRSFLTRASENNNELRAAFQKWKAAVSRAARADTLPDPRFTFGYYTTPLETRGGPARYKYGLSQTLPFFGKLDAKEQMALRDADGLKARFDELKLKTFYEVKSVYYEYAYLARAIDITKENTELMEYLEKIATARYTTGTAKHSDIMRPQVELGKLEDRLNSLEDLRRPLAARLNALLDRAPEAEIPFPRSIPIMSITDSDESLFARLSESNPQLTYWDTVQAKEEAGKDLAERGYYPDFTFGLDVTKVDEARNPGVIGDGRNPVMATMSFNLPIWLNAREAAVDESQSKISAARRSRLGVERKLKADLELALYKYRDAVRKIDLYRDTLVPKAKQSLGVTMEAFMTGAGTSLDLIDAEQTLLELQLAYYRSLTDQAQRLAEIETLVGTELPCEFHGSLLKTDE